MFDFTADVVVNTTGAWVDLTNEAMGAASSFMGGTKGSHIVLDHPELLAACNGREIFFEHTDGRIVLIYPMGDRVLVGTTDVDADMAQDAVCTEAEIDYFFDLIGHVFPDIPVGRDQIVYSFSGVRPLPKHDATQPGFVSRDYRIERRAAADGAVLSLVGGKWTTFRALAEHLSNDVLAELGMERKVSTAKLAIGGGAGFPDSEDGVQRWIKAHMSAGRDAARVTGLLTRYGTRAEEVIRFLDGAAAGEQDRLLHSTRELSTRELEFMAAHRADRAPGGRPHPPHVPRLSRPGDRGTAQRSRGHPFRTARLGRGAPGLRDQPRTGGATAVPRCPGPTAWSPDIACVPGQGSPGASTARSALAAGAVAGRQHEHAAGPTASKLADADNRK